MNLWNYRLCGGLNWLRGVDLNHRPLGYEHNRTTLTACDSNALTPRRSCKYSLKSRCFGANLVPSFRLAGESCLTAFPAEYRSATTTPFCVRSPRGIPTEANGSSVGLRMTMACLRKPNEKASLEAGREKLDLVAGGGFEPPTFGL